MTLHLGLLVLLSATLQRAPAGQDEIPGQEVGLVLKQETQQGEIYEGPALQQPEPPTEQAVDLQDSLQHPPVDLSEVLPEHDQPVIGPGLPNVLPSVQPPIQRRGSPARAATKTGVAFFGVEDPAQRIVYVVDRSASMSDRNRLGMARVELLASLESLDPTQQFQIIFYNQTPFLFRTDRSGRMPFADELTKTLAGRFVQGVFPNGATDHQASLLEAMRLRPDAIFFLTDADEPKLKPDEIHELTRHNGGRTRIHAIEFGVGPELGEDNFLKQLARRNGGTYRYVNVDQARR